MTLGLVRTSTEQRFCRAIKLAADYKHVIGDGSLAAPVAPLGQTPKFVVCQSLQETQSPNLLKPLAALSMAVAAYRNVLRSTRIAFRGLLSYSVFGSET